MYFSNTNTKIVSGIIGFLVLIGILTSWSIISPGYTGIVFNKISGNVYTSGQGIAFRIPFITTVRSYPISLRTYTMNESDSIDLPTKEGQHIKQDLSITYNTSPDKAAEVFKNFKGADIDDIEKTFIRRTIMTTAQNIAGQMSLTELISSDRGKLQNNIEKELKQELNKMGFVLDKVNLGASHLPESIEKQMQQKMAAQQQAQQADYELQKQQTLAKSVVAEAKGKAEALVITAQAQARANNLLQASLSPLLVEIKKIEKWNGVLPQVSSSSAVPLINFSGKK